MDLSAILESQITNMCNSLLSLSTETLPLAKEKNYSGLAILNKNSREFFVMPENTTIKEVKIVIKWLLVGGRFRKEDLGELVVLEPEEVDILDNQILF